STPPCSRGPSRGGRCGSSGRASRSTRGSRPGRPLSSSSRRASTPTATSSTGTTTSGAPSTPPAPAPRRAYHAGIHRNADPLYAVPNRRVVKHFVEAAPVRVSSLRSLGAFANVFAIESFLDELAAAVGADPLELRLSLLPDERAREVLRAAAAAIGWPGPRGESGRGAGLGFARYKNQMCYAAV